MSWSKEQVTELASPLLRKYDWRVEDIDGGVRLTVFTVGAEASVDITGLEDIRSEATRLVKEVDAGIYRNMEE